MGKREKITNVEQLKGLRVAALVSGGLDSTTFVRWLTDHGVKVYAITADVGQPDEKDMEDILRRMKAAGAVEAHSVDARNKLAAYGMLMVQGLGGHEGGYLNTTGIARMATMAAVMPLIKGLGIKIVVHGATGRGNDQVRFELATACLEPDMHVYAPWRDPEFIADFGGRKEMIAYCQTKGLEVSATVDKPYSTDANFLGLTHEAGLLEYFGKRPDDIIQYLMGVKPKDAPDQEQLITIEFEEGNLATIGIHHSDMSVPEVLTYGDTYNMICTLNRIAGENGVGIGIDVVENRRVGIKSRGVYESPGLTLLFAAYRKMVEFHLDRDRRKLFEINSQRFGDLIYEGEFFSPLCSDLLAFFKNVSSIITGKVTFALYKGNIRFVTASDMPHSLYDPENSSMENVGGFNHESSQGLLDIAGGAARVMAEAGQTSIPE